MPDQRSLHAGYMQVKKHCAANWKSAEAGEAIFSLAQESLEFLNSEAAQIGLASRVPGKQYLSYQLQNTVARPANRDYFITDEAQFLHSWIEWRNGRSDIADLRRLLYTVALAPCLAMELFDRQNKKGPATYFECFIGHVFSSTLDQNPIKRATLPLEDREIRMTMDFLFEGGNDRPSIHLPVKMSTRERVVQAWSHQRLLDAAFGTNTYTGIMVLFSETKMNSRNGEVVEICVPDQWLIYQTYLSRMECIYYFDVPERYEILTNSYPELITIRQFGDFFVE